MNDQILKARTSFRLAELRGRREACGGLFATTSIRCDAGRSAGRLFVGAVNRSHFHKNGTTVMTTTGKNRIMINGPKEDGTYVVWGMGGAGQHDCARVFSSGFSISPKGKKPRGLAGPGLLKSPNEVEVGVMAPSSDISAWVCAQLNTKV